MTIWPLSMSLADLMRGSKVLMCHAVNSNLFVMFSYLPSSSSYLLAYPSRLAAILCMLAGMAKAPSCFRVALGKKTSPDVNQPVPSQPMCRCLRIL